MMGHISLLDAIANGDADWLEPSYETNTQSVRHPIVGESSETLEILFDEDLLRREFVKRVIACPECGADHLKFELQCPDCHSGNTVPVDIHEHTVCGCVQPREAFSEDGVERCPECTSDIESFAEECELMGTMHHCRTCDGRFDSLTEYLDCPDCGPHTLTDVDTYRLHRYRFNEDRRGWLDRLVAMRDDLTRGLEADGYEIELGGHCAESAPRTDLQATDPTRETDLAVEIRDSINVETISDLQTVVDGTEAHPIVATAGESGSAATLAEEHGITVFEMGAANERTLNESVSGSSNHAIDRLFASVPNTSSSKALLPQ
ncbi:hypothetical protein [Halococcus sp. IIIV-5B]|uniref:TackOD1 domain-containing metal-binding protein n=1 Tax=Halococcus sp. IIIV-5B TaxID=2321230 RepID=UPI000E742672|nr:hypothetical protein [Halococcus sp. IIIV-5B]RJT07968.1 hypothetical protein D3261_01080 [Halococcus sp. IIIV-5B]